MALKTGLDRDQIFLFPTSLDEAIEQDNLVRAVDAIVESFDLKELGFKPVEDEKLGATSYSMQSLIKLYLYGYINRITSSRKLAQECKRNIEVMWLMKNLKPEYRTIANFRTLVITEEKDGKILEKINHPKALGNVFKKFMRYCREWKLIKLEEVSVDGTLIKAKNSRANLISEDKLDYLEQRVDEQTNEYFVAMDKADTQETQEEGKGMASMELEKFLAMKKSLAQKRELLQAAQQKDPATKQICLTDPDAKLLSKGKESIVGYNLQLVVDAENKIPVYFELFTENDICLSSRVLGQVKEDFNIIDRFRGLLDAGYHHPKEMAKMEQMNIEAYVGVPDKENKTSTCYTRKDFQYDAQSDRYICPDGQQLSRKDKAIKKGKYADGTDKEFYEYTCPMSICRTCPHINNCITANSKQRNRPKTIKRGIHQDQVDANAKRIAENPQIYKRRKATVEHPFGTIKRGWHKDHTSLKGLNKVRGEFAIILTAYAIVRILNIMGTNKLLEELKAFFFRFFIPRAVMRRHIISLVKAPDAKAVLTPYPSHSIRWAA